MTGDEYVQATEGYFWYQARTDDMIITGGCNIAGPEGDNVPRTQTGKLQRYRLREERA